MELLQGYKQALSTLGIPAEERYIWLSGSERESTGIYEIDNGINCAQYFLQMRDKPTGFVAINDLTALGAMRGFLMKGLRIPQDISIIGFDNISYCDISTPGLTTIDQQACEMGAVAARLLIGQIEHPDVVQYTMRLQPKLVERGSVSFVPV